VTTEAFLVIYGDTSIHEHIQSEARRHTRNVEFQKDLCQEAWLRIAQEPTGQRSLEWYCEEGGKAIKSVYMQNYRIRKNDEEVFKTFRDWYCTRYE
jgi:hypothetical protein